MSKARMTFRLDEDRNMNRKDSNNGLLSETKRSDHTLNDYDSLNPYTLDYGAWNSPFDAETERIEQLIRESLGSKDRLEKPVSAPELTDDYVSAAKDHPVIVDDAYKRHSNRSRTSWFKILGSIAGAAGTGVVLGFLVLSMFTTMKDHKDASANPVNQEARAVTAPVQDAVAIAQEDSAIGGQDTVVSIPDRSYTILQHGIFAGAEGAELAKKDLAARGMAAIIDHSDKYYVYAGIAADHNGGLALSQQFKSDNVDIYVKSFELPALSKVKWNGSGTVLSDYLSQADKLVNLLSNLTLIHLEEDGPAKLDDATKQVLKSAHSAWNQTAPLAVQGAAPGVQASVQKMNNALNSSVASIDEYEKNPSAAMLWQVQTYLLQFVVAENGFLARIKA